MIPSPNTKSEGDAPISGLTVVLNAKRVIGSLQNHWSLSPWPNATRLSFKRRCSLSTIPFDSGWYAVVMQCRIPQFFRSCVKICEENWLPRSVVMTSGTPYTEIQPWVKASTTVSAFMSGIGIATGHLVKRSTTVSKWLNPFDGGIETRSRCRC